MVTRLERAAGFLVALSWARLLVSGHPSPDLGALPFPLDLVGAAGFVAVVLVCLRAHLGRVAQAAGDPAGGRGLTREALVLALVAGLMVPFLSGDLFSALAYAELVVKASVDPFTLPAPGLAASSFLPYLSPRWREAPCVYGPLQLFFWSPAARFAASLPAALAVAKLLAVGGGDARLLRRYCSTPEGSGPRPCCGRAQPGPVGRGGPGARRCPRGLLFAAWLWLPADAGRARSAPPGAAVA
jgi:hypothetical protein